LSIEACVRAIEHLTPGAGDSPKCDKLRLAFSAGRGDHFGMSTPTTSSDCNSPTEHPQPVPNTVAWNELVSPDPKAALAFYGGLFGWTAEVMPMPNMEYMMLKQGDRFFGGICPTPQPGIPPHWLHYVYVTDIQGTLEKAVGLGATVCLPVTAIGDAGRIAILKDPQGAVFGLHTGK
jgi:predicted enzyme related to lactoylglutathione lyase